MKFENLCMSFGTQVIFDDVTFQINDIDKVGIVGVNGAGKTTLFNLILKKLDFDSGKIILPNNVHLGYLPQVISESFLDDLTVYEYLLSGRPIKELREKLNGLYIKISDISDDKKMNIYLKKISKIEDKLNYYDEYNAEAELLKILYGMNIKDELLNLKLKNVSGGQKSKLAFAKLLYSKPNVLLLDEPTNHLDGDTKDYIIGYLQKYKGLILVISHDIDFLNKVTNKTMFVDKITHKIQVYHGNYEKYLKIKNELDIAKKRLYEKQSKEEQKLKNIISKYLHGNEKKANIAKDRIRKLEKLQKEKIILEKNNKYTSFKIKINYPSYLVPISCKNLSFGYNDKLIMENLSFDVSRGEKFLIIGENGVGKTTLLRLILNILKPSQGEIIVSLKTQIGYYAQEHEILDNNKTIIDNFNEFGLPVYELRKILGSFLFLGDDIFKKVSVLSLGEKSRVALAKISLQGANTLLLDEPTNHLDPMTQLIIAETFKNYEGTMLVVSHNLDFVDNLGINRMLLLPSGKVMYYDRDIVMYYEQVNKKE